MCKLFLLKVVKIKDTIDLPKCRILNFMVADLFKEFIASLPLFTTIHSTIEQSFHAPSTRNIISLG